MTAAQVLPRQDYTSTFIIAASPLAKIFNKKYVAKCLEDPERIFKEERFFCEIKKPSGNITLEYGAPTDARNLVRAGNDWRPTYDWLVGGPGLNETDCYGVVALRSDVEMMRLMSAAQTELFRLDPRDTKAIERAQAKQREMEKDIQAKLMDARKQARSVADDKIKRVMRWTHRNMQNQIQRNKESGFGYNPSDVEFLGLRVLHDELAKSNENRKRIMEQFSQMNAIIQGF